MNRHIKRIKKMLDNYEEGMKIMSDRGLDSDIKYSLDKMREYIDAFFERGPFKIGDKVQIVKAPKIEKDSGWWGSRHYLVIGSQGWVKSVDFSKGKFNADIMWDDESWIPFDETDPRPARSKHVYHMWENQIQKIEVEPCSMHHATVLKQLVGALSEGTQKQLYCYTICCPECHRDLDTTEIQKEYKEMANK